MRCASPTRVDEVKAARQQRADLDVGLALRGDGGRQPLFDLCDDLVVGLRVVRGGVVGEIPVGLEARLRGSRKIDLAPGRGRDGADALEEGFLQRRVPKSTQERRDQRMVGLRLLSIGGRENLLDFGGKEDRAPAVDLPVDRLDAEAVARHHQSIAVQVENGDAPHAVQTIEAALAPLPIGGKHDLGIAVGAKHLAQQFKLPPEFAEVVDLAVEGDPGLAVGTAHRLIGQCAEIADLQTPEREANPRGTRRTQNLGRGTMRNAAALVGHEEALAVGSAMADHGMHRDQPLDQARRLMRIENDANAAHGA